jgi:predicted amidohydrolase
LNHYDQGVVLQACRSFGEARGRGNLLAIQPDLRPLDYASASTLQARLAGYLDVARAQGWLTPKTIALFPEHIGSWLLAVDQFAPVYRAQTLHQALPWLILRRPGQFMRAWRMAQGRSRLQDALFRTSAEAMARHYQAIFGALAQCYAITLVAGSIVLPNPHLSAGQLQIRPGALYNSSGLFRPDGSLASPLVFKQFPTTEELTFLSPGPAFEPPVFDTPAGRLGVLICADSWYPAPYQSLASQGAELLAVPAFLTGNGAWAAPWPGYNGAAPPDDVATHHRHTLTEGEAWRTYAMPGRMRATTLRAGMTVYLRGRLWDLGGDGHTLVMCEGQLAEGAQVDGAALINLWL